MKKTGLPKHWISALFKKWQARYGHKWVSAIDGIEELAVNEWAQVLEGITGEQIAYGLELWEESWPPSAPEFKAACLGSVKNRFGLDYIPECYREKPIVDESKLLSSDQRDASRKAGREEIDKMKDLLKGK